MRAPTTLLAASLVLALCGCPDPDGGPQRSSSPPLAASQPRGVAVPQLAPPALALEPARAPIVRALDPDTPAVVPANRLEQVARGGVLEPGGRLSLGHVGPCTLEGRPYVRLNAAEGQLSLEYTLQVGDRGRLSGARFTVVASEAGGVRLAWSERFAEGDPHVVRELDHAWSGLETICLEEMGLYRFSDGVVVAVGNVVRTKTPRITINVFPAWYERDPMSGYDRHTHVSAGQELRGKHATFVLEQVDPGAPGTWGAVTLRRNP